MATNTLERAFFGKESCLVLSLSKNGICFFQFGKLRGSDWLWKKVKMSDLELGKILRVLNSRENKATFYHSFGEQKSKKETRIWVERLPNGKVIFRAGESAKALGLEEQEVMAVLIRHIIILMNLKL